MTPEQFCYWLRGFFELGKVADVMPALTPKQVALVDQHLQLVFTNVITVRETASSPNLELSPGTLIRGPVLSDERRLC